MSFSLDESSPPNKSALLLPIERLGLVSSRLTGTIVPVLRLLHSLVSHLMGGMFGRGPHRYLLVTAHRSLGVHETVHSC